jgi:hypothetical protein
MSAHGLTLDQCEEFQAAILDNAKDFGVKKCSIIKNPAIPGEWGVHLEYEYDDKGKREASSIDVFEDYKLGGIVHALYERASVDSLTDIVRRARQNGDG